MRKFLLAICVLIITSCSKNEEIRKTFTGTLPIIFTNSPTTITIGQKIISDIKCELTSISGSVYFNGFEITETLIHQYKIRATAR